MLFVEQKVNLNFLPNPKHEVPVWAIWSPKNLQEYLGHRSLDWWSWCPEEVQDCCMWRYQSVLPMFSSVRGFWIIFFCVLLFFITIICAPCFFGVFFLGGGGFGFKQNKIRWCIFSLFEWNPTGWVKIFVENLRSTPSPALGFLRTFEVCNKSFQSRRIVPLADGWWWKKTYRYRYGYLLKQGLCGYARSFVL